MTKVRAHNLSMSLDGYLAGPDQSIDIPLGVGGESLHEWMFKTRTWKAMQGESGGETGTVDEHFASRMNEGVGAGIMGRNMFGPVRGPWPDESWRGWWGDTPPYHHPMFVLTHHARAPIEMKGGTTFHFVTEGIESALEQATRAADGQDVAIAGGASTIQQYMRAGLIDDMHVVVVPILLGGGERLFYGGESLYECVEFAASPGVAHARFTRTS
jgi:dihydrofolate reductase